MLRGIRTKTWAAWLLTGFMLAGSPTALYARNKPAQGKAEKAKTPSVERVAAPDMEDHANYFSENRKDVSPEDLKKADALRRKTISSIEDLLTSKKKSIRRFELLLRFFQPQRVHVLQGRQPGGLLEAACERAFGQSAGLQHAGDGRGRRGRRGTRESGMT